MVIWFTISQTGIVSEGGSGEPSLTEMQEAVGGFIQVITLPSHNQIWVNEEGKFQRLPVNDAATALLWDAGMMFGKTLVGNVVMVYTGDVDYQDCYEHVMQYDRSVEFQDYTKISLLGEEE